MSDPQNTTPETASSPTAMPENLREQLQPRQVTDDDPETTLWQGGYSPKAMIGSWIVCSVITIAALVLAGMYLSGYFLWVFFALLLMWLVVGGIYAARRYGFHYELTTQRFIHQTGVLSRRTDRIELIDVDDVITRQGPIQRILGVGNIVIESSDRSHPELEMVGIADVRSVSTMIDEVRRKERRRRSVHIESI